MRWSRPDPTAWRFWFAWYPVQLTDDQSAVRHYVWLEWIERRKRWTWLWDYRLDYRLPETVKVEYIVNDVRETSGVTGPPPKRHYEYWFSDKYKIR